MLIPITLHPLPLPARKGINQNLSPCSSPHLNLSLPNLLSQFRQYFRPQPAAIDTPLGNLLLQLPYYLWNIHQHTPAAKHSKIRPVPKCHNRLIRILTTQPVMHLTAGLTRRREC